MSLDPVRLGPHGEPWVLGFTIATGVLCALCLRAGVQRARAHGLPRPLAREAATFAAFALAFWIFESYARVRTPFFLYPAGWPAALPPWPLPFLPPPRIDSECVRCVQRLLAQAGSHGGIPLPVIAMEACLVYALRWILTALAVPVLRQPLYGALALVGIDLFLDPAVTAAFDCSARPRIAGANFWPWFVDPRFTAVWFGVPLYNFAAWLAAPLVLLAALRWIAPDADRRGSARDGSARRAIRRSLALQIGGGIALLVAMSPAALAPPAWLQWSLLTGAIGTAALASVPIAWHARAAGPLDARFLLPCAFYLGFPAAVWLGSGAADKSAWLAAVGLGAGALVALLTAGGGSGPLGRIAVAIRTLDRFTRVHYFGFSALLVLLGAGSVDPDPDAARIAGLLAIAACFHVFAYVLNDVLDLPVDRTQPRRAQDPLVRGDISVRAALGIVAATLPAAAGIVAALGGGARAQLLLATAFALLAIYDRYGKRCPFPPLTDAVQGVGWGTLALLGAELCGGAANLHTWIVFGYGLGFIFLVNGIHGGLRDLANDRARGQRTTALLLGARPGRAAGTAEDLTGSRIFAHAVHAFLGALLLAQLATSTALRGAVALGSAALAGAVLTAASFFFLARVTATTDAGREDAVERHGFVLLCSLVLLSLPELGITLAALTAASFFAPLLSLDPYLGWILRSPASPAADPSAGASAQPGRTRAGAIPRR